MSASKKVKYVIRTEGKERHSRISTTKKRPGLYEEPDIVSSSDEELQSQNKQIKNADQLNDYMMRLIVAVHKRPPLWDSRLSKAERNHSTQVNLWNEVDRELRAAQGKAKKKWQVLRKEFGAERRRIEDGQPPKWQYYNPLFFLNPVLKSRRRRSKMSKSTSSTLSTELKVIESVDDEIESRKIDNQEVSGKTEQSVPVSSKRVQKGKELFLNSQRNSFSFEHEEQRHVSSSDSEVDVENITGNGDTFLPKQTENSIPYKRLCIRQMQETHVQNLVDVEDDEVRRFCSYLEVMLRKLPREHQEMFCEETLEHLATINRKLRRSHYY